MAKKLHERFLKADAEYPCEQCEKVRKTCRDCSCCKDCCRCEYCDLCGLPNGFQSECTCFQCESCYRTCAEDQQVVDDGDYETEFIDPKKNLQYICLSCYNQRKKLYLEKKNIRNFRNYS